MKNPKKVVSKIGGVILGLSMVASVFPQTAQAQFIQRSFLNPSFEQNLTPSTANPSSPGAATIPINTRTNCFIQVDQTSVPGWSTTHPLVAGSGNCPSFSGTALPGLANLIELWTDTFQGVLAPNGRVFAELNAERNSQLFQNLCLFNDETINFSVNHRGRASASFADVANFAVNNIGAVQFSTSSSGTPSSIASLGPGNATNIVTNAPASVGASAPGWVRYSGSLRYTGLSSNVPVGFDAISTGGGNITIGNFIDDTQFAGLPVIEFSATSGGAAEAESNPTSNPPKIRVVGLVPAGGIVVPISIGSGTTALLGTDFNTPTGTTNFTVTIPAGNYDGSNATSTFFIPFTIIQDGITEGNETIVFEIGSSPGVYFISSTTACGTSPIQNATYTVFDDEFLSGNVFNDLDNSAAGTFIGIQNGAEVGTNAGGLLNAILVSSAGNVLATTPVNANGTYIFNDVPFNQTSVTIRLSATAGTLGNAAPAASLPAGWVATSPLVTAPFSTGTSIANKDFGITQPIVFGYKSVALTADLDNNNTVTSDDRLTWRVSYANTGTVDVPNFQISDVLPSNVTLFVTLGVGNITVNAAQTITPVANASYTGAGDNNLFNSSFILKAGGVVTVDIPVTINSALPNGTILSNQPTGISNGLPAAGVRTDNIDNTTASLPAGVTAIASSIIQTQNAGTIDPTTVTVGFSNPKLLLVKRITAINDVVITNAVNDGVASSDDDNVNWITTSSTTPINATGYLQGDITRNDVKPSDRIEYTIYFLSAGNTAITNVTICDLIPPNTTFVNNAYDVVGGGNNFGIVFANSTITPTSYLTGLFDGDRAKFYPANTVPPTACKKPTTNLDLNAADNTDGIVVVDVVISPALLPFANGFGLPTNSYGFVRFQVKVK